MKKKICWSDILKFPTIHYNVNIPLGHLEENLQIYVKDHNLNMNPDFQRAHVWNEEQQIAYMEYLLMEPQIPQQIVFNHPNWMGSFKGEMVLLDGKQRLEAARKWLNNEIPAHGYYRKDFTHMSPEYPLQKSGRIPTDINLSFCIMKLKTREEILKWYINFNSGGTPHTNDEIERVKKLLEEK